MPLGQQFFIFPQLNYENEKILFFIQYLHRLPLRLRLNLSNPPPHPCWHEFQRNTGKLLRWLILYKGKNYISVMILCFNIILGIMQYGMVLTYWCYTICCVGYSSSIITGRHLVFIHLNIAPWIYIIALFGFVHDVVKELHQFLEVMDHKSWLQWVEKRWNW